MSRYVVIGPRWTHHSQWEPPEECLPWFETEAPNARAAIVRAYREDRDIRASAEEYRRPGQVPYRFLRAVRYPPHDEECEWCPLDDRIAAAIRAVQEQAERNG